MTERFLSNHEAKTTLASHPGQFIRSSVIEPAGLNVKDAAEALGVHRVALSRLLNEQAALSADMAIRLQKAFGVDMEMLMRMQSDHDIAQAKSRYDRIILPSMPAAITAKRRVSATARLGKKSAQLTKRKAGDR